MVKIIYTKHALNKFGLLEQLGWKISKRKVNQTVRKPKWLGRSRLGEYAAMSQLGRGYLLRVIYDKLGNDIKVITFHPARKGRYEANL